MNSDFEFDSSTIDNQNITCSIEKLNENNIIINDSDCSDSFIEKISSKLEEKGLKFRKTKNCIFIRGRCCLCWRKKIFFKSKCH